MYFTRRPFQHCVFVMKMKMSGHHLKYLLLLIVYGLHEFIVGDSVGIKSFPIDTVVCSNDTATYSCEVFGSSVNWCIDNNCTTGGSLPHTSYTTELKPASGTLYSVLHVYVPLFYNNSLVKCCVVPGNNCSQVVTLRVHCPKNKNDSSEDVVASIITPDITPSATVKPIALTETPETNSTHDFTPSNDHWPVIVGVIVAILLPTVIVILAVGTAICYRKGCHCKPKVKNSSQEEKKTDIVTGCMTEEPSVEKEEPSVEKEEPSVEKEADVTVVEHEQVYPSSSDLAISARRMLRPPLNATRRTTDESVSWENHDSGESSVNHVPVFFCTQLSGKPNNTGPQLCQSAQKKVNTSQMDIPGHCGQQLCVFISGKVSSSLQPLYSQEDSSKGHLKRTFSYPSDSYIVPNGTSS